MVRLLPLGTRPTLSKSSQSEKQKFSTLNNGDAAAQTWCKTTDQIVEILRYVLEGLPHRHFSGKPLVHY